MADTNENIEFNVGGKEDPSLKKAFGSAQDMVDAIFETYAKGSKTSKQALETVSKVLKDQYEAQLALRKAIRETRKEQKKLNELVAGGHVNNMDFAKDEEDDHNRRLRQIKERKEAEEREAKDKKKRRFDLMRNRSKMDMAVEDSARSAAETQRQLEKKRAEENIRSAQQAAKKAAAAERKRKLDRLKGIDQELRALKIAHDKEVKLAEDARRKKQAAAFGSNRAVPNIQAMQSLSQAQGMIGSGQVSAERMSQIFKTVRTEGIKAFAGLSREEQKAAMHAQRYFDAVSRGSRRGIDALHKMSATVRNIVVSFTVYRAIAQIQDEIVQAVDQAAEFELKIQEVRTIQADAAKSTEAWRHELVSLSNEFGLDVIDVTTSAYQALSNQVVGAADSYSFLRQSVLFARVTVTDATNAVNLLSSAINAFNFQTIQAEAIAARFFKTIELGRLKAEDLANDYGVSASLAAQLGVTMSEVNAVLVTLTRQGVKASVAQTLLNNVMLKMIKPTGQMNDLIKEWGVSSGQAAIQTFGLYDILRKLNAEAETGGAERLGELFSRMRAIRGIGSILQDADRVGETLEQLGATGDSLEEITANVTKLFDNYRQQQEKITGSVGLQLDKLKQQLNNTFRETLGNRVMAIMFDLIESFGGVEKGIKNLVNAVSGMATALTPPIRLFIQFLGLLVKFSDIVIPGTVAALGIYVGTLTGVTTLTWNYTAATNAAAISTKALWALLAANPIGVILAATGAAYAFFSLQHSRNMQKIATIESETIQELRDHHKEWIDSLQEVIKVDLEVQEAWSKRRIQFIRRAFVEENKQQFERAKQFLKIESDLQYDLVKLNSGFKSMFPVEYFKDSEELLEHYRDRVKDVAEKLNDLRKKTALNSMDLGELMSVSGDNLPAALDKAKSIADKMFEKAKSEVEDITDTISEIKTDVADRKFQQALEAMSDSEKQSAIRGRIASLRNQAMSSSTLEGGRAIFSRVENLVGQLNRLQQSQAAEYEKFGVKKPVDYTIENKIAQDRIKFEEQFLQKAQQGQEMYKQNLEQIQNREEAHYENKLKSLQMEAMHRHGIRKQMDEKLKAQESIVEKMEEESAALQKQLGMRSKLIEEYNASLDEQAGMLANIGARLRNMPRSGFIDYFAAPTYDAMNIADQLEGVTDFEEKARIIQKVTEQLSSARKDMRSMLDRTSFSDNENKKQLESFDEQMKRLEKIDVKSGMNALRNNEKRIEQLKESLGVQDMTTKELQEQGKAYVQIEDSNKETEASLKRQLDTIIKINQNLNDSLPAAPGRSSGGLIGGMPGRDNQYFRAHRGEMVMNPTATAQYLPILQTMNAGMPAFSSGGTVFNGDMNFTMENNSTNPAEFAGEVYRHIKRGVKSGRFRSI